MRVKKSDLRQIIREAAAIEDPQKLDEFLSKLGGFLKKPMGMMAAATGAMMLLPSLMGSKDVSDEDKQAVEAMAQQLQAAQSAVETWDGSPETAPSILASVQQVLGGQPA